MEINEKIIWRKLSMKRLIVLLIIPLLLSGCIEEDPKAEQLSEEVSASSSQRESTTQLVEMTVREQINNITIPTTIEEWHASESGVFATEYTYDHETSSWPKDSRELTDEELEEIRAVTSEMKDIPTLYKMLRYYFASNTSNDLLEEQINYTAELTEPYLPSPRKETMNAEEGIESPSKAILLLDASSSMLLPVEGKQKMNIAKTAIKRFASTIGEESEVSLYVYGHAGTQADKDKQLSCNQIDEIYPLQAYDAKQFDSVVDGVEAKGWTPLAAAIKAVYEANKDYEDSITVYIVSDGAETCDGDPIREAAKFAKDGQARKVNIIGFNVDQQGEDQLKDVAAAGNGEYISAETGEELNLTIEEKWIIPSSIDVIYKRVNGNDIWTAANAKYNLGQNFIKLQSVIAIESARIRDMIILLEQEGILSKEQKEELIKKVEEQQKQLYKLNSDLKQMKENEVNSEYNRIKDKIEAWATEVEKIREEQK